MVAGSIFLAHNGNMMIGAIDCGTHQVSSAGITADVFFINMLLVNSGSYQRAVRCQHITAKLGEQLNIAHACRYKHLFKHLAHAFADCQYIVILLLRLIGNADTAAEVDKGDMRAGFFLQLNCQLEQNTCQLRIVFIGNGIRSQEGMNTEILYALALEDFISLNNLLMSHTVFCIAGVIHNVVGNGKMSAGIVTAADGFRNVGNLLQKVNMSNIIQIDGYIQFTSQFKVLCRSCIGGEHNLALLKAYGIAHLQLGIGGTVGTAALFAQDLEQIGVRCSLYCEIFFKALVPGKSLVNQTRGATDAGLIIQMEGSRILRYDFF